MLDDTAFRGQVATQDGDGTVGADGLVEAADDVGALDLAADLLALLGQQGIAVLVEAVLLQLLQILAQGLAGNGLGIQMQHGLDLFHDAGHAACIVEILCGPVACGTDVQQVVCAAVHPVKGVGVDLEAELVGNGGDVHQGIGGAGNGRMDHDGVLKAAHIHDIACGDTGFHQLHQLCTGVVGSLLQLGGSGRHQSGAGQHQAQSLGHDLHGGGSAHKGAGAAAGAGVLLVVGQLLGRDLAALVLCAELADLLQGEQLVDGTAGVVLGVLGGQVVCLHDTAGDHDGCHHVLHAADAHEHGGHGLVAAGNEHTAVKGGGVGLCFHQVGDGFAVGQRVVDTVMALCHAVAHVGGKIPGSLAAVVVHAADSLFHKDIQVAGARMAVAVGALHHDLGLAQVIDRPAHAHAQGVHLRGQGTDLLTFQNHI